MGDAVVEQWRTPRVVGRFGEDGIDGVDGVDGTDGVDGAPGDDGEDALGFEYVFAAHTAVDVNTNQLPRNQWGYDEPVTRNGVAWMDAAPALTATNPYLIRAQRVVVGAPAVGDAVPAAWSEPVAVGRLGSDGSDGTDGDDGIDGAPGAAGADGTDGDDGADGDDGSDGDPGADGAPGVDGVGIEWIFAAHSGSTTNANQRPDNDWGYDSPETINGVAWKDGAPGLTAALPYLFQSQRRVFGVPAVGAAVVDDWTFPVVVGRYFAGDDELEDDDMALRRGAVLTADVVLGTAAANRLTVAIPPDTPSDKFRVDVVVFFSATSSSKNIVLTIRRGGVDISTELTISGCGCGRVTSKHARAGHVLGVRRAAGGGRG